MTRRSIAAILASLLVGLLLVGNAPAASAGGLCGTGYAPEHCEEMAAATDAMVFAAGAQARPVHILSGSGMGQEQFEAREAANDTVQFRVASVGPAIAVQTADAYFLEFNTITLPSAGAETYMEDLTPIPGHPY